MRASDISRAALRERFLTLAIAYSSRRRSVKTHVRNRAVTRFQLYIISCFLFTQLAFGQQSPSIAGEWLDDFGGAGTFFGSVNSMVVYDPEGLCFGGSFELSGDFPLEVVGCWNGNTFSDLGRPFGVYEMAVFAMEKFKGNLVVGGNGYWESNSGISWDGLAVWNGSGWSPLEGLTNSGFPFVSVYALHSTGDTLYVGGDFTHAGGKLSKGIAAWDGSEWHALAGGVSGPVRSDMPSGDVYAITSDSDGLLYVGGIFSEAGGQAAGGVAVWNEGQWQSIGQGVDGRVFSLSVGAEGKLLIGGSFEQAGGVTASNVALWNGIDYESLGEGVDEDVEAVLISEDGTMFIGGYFRKTGSNPLLSVAQWIDQSWDPVGLGFNHSVNAFFVDSGLNLYTAGAFSRTGDRAIMKIARLDDGDWEDVITLERHGIDDTIWDVEFVGTSIVVGGEFNRAGQLSSPSFTAWNGTNWERDTDDPGLRVHSVHVGEDETIYVGGYYQASSPVPSVGIAKRLLGSSWVTIGTEFNGPINDITICKDGHLVVGGSFSETDSRKVSYLAEFDGDSWNEIEGLDGFVHSLLCLNQSLFVGGEFSTSGSAQTNGLAEWDGNTWKQVGGGLGSGSKVYALAATDADGLVVGGDIDAAGGTPINNLALWNGQSWDGLSGGTDGTVLTIAARNDSIVVGGQFGGAGMTQANNVALYDDTHWWPLGIGLNGPVQSLIWTNSTVTVGGSFSLAGGRVSNNFAEWRFAQSLSTDIGQLSLTGPGVHVSVYPNPFRTTFVTDFVLTDRHRVELVVTNLIGQQVFRSGVQEMGPGSHRRRITLPSTVAAGSYFCLLLIDGVLQGTHPVVAVR